MSTFALDNSYNQFNFEEITVDDLTLIAGGSGSINWQCVTGVAGGYYTGGLMGAIGLGGLGAVVGGLPGAAIGASIGWVIGGTGGALQGASDSCFA